jgi:hypothetical protein
MDFFNLFFYAWQALVLGTFKKLSYKSGTGNRFQADFFPGKWQGIGTGKGKYIIYIYTYGIVTSPILD